ncbi:serine/threonine-protein kinase LATS2-like isoform X2 [Mya arenaria]|uniref:serine/threonine-protein kinase LATS2-like isoform X2 n=1 Tax=Mya arenaria TaxID=6604 RepID=UPI0022E8CDDC|nr:serine/threonine-protein kinase LATS2-like isoform X2 [Mya arenaria]
MQCLFFTEESEVKHKEISESLHHLQSNGMKRFQPGTKRYVETVSPGSDSASTGSDTHVQSVFNTAIPGQQGGGRNPTTISSGATRVISPPPVSQTGIMVNGHQTPPPVPPRLPMAVTVGSGVAGVQHGQSPVNSEHSFTLTHSSMGTPKNHSTPVNVVNSRPVSGISPAMLNESGSIARHMVSPMGMHSEPVTIKYPSPGQPPPYSISGGNSRQQKGPSIKITSSGQTIHVQRQHEQFKIQLNHSGSGKPVDVYPRNQPPIHTQVVESTSVHKPQAQKATMPIQPQDKLVPGNKYTSSVQTMVNNGQQQKQQLRGVQISYSDGQNHIIYPPERMTPEQQHAYQQRIQQNFNHHSPLSVHIKLRPNQHLVNQNELYGPVDTSISTSRSCSPLSNSTNRNQSPMSISSTNSDIPDHPPPPYPGQGPTRPLKISHEINTGKNIPIYPKPQNPTQVPLQYPQVQKVNSHAASIQKGMCTAASNEQPPLPPRIPLHKNNTPPTSLQTGESQPPNIPPKEFLVKQQHGNPDYGSEDISMFLRNNTEMAEVGKLPQLNITNDGDTDSEVMSQASDVSEKKRTCTSPIPERKPDSEEKDILRKDSTVRNYSPAAYKFFMEQHVENLIKNYSQRQNRKMQLEKEMAKANLSEDAQLQMRRMLQQKESNYIRMKRSKMKRDMFEKIKKLGVGAFGEVHLVKKKDIDQLYAMKTLRKIDVYKRNQVAHVKAERDILAEADNEWVVKLYYSFQDRDNLYFVMDYIPGGDLMGLLIRKEIFDQPLARFYIAELVLAIESVHKMGFIHRDIKPDNILIDKNGHIKLTDFGLCTGFRWTHNSKYYQKDGFHPRQESMDLGDSHTTDCKCPKQKTLDRRKMHRKCIAQSLVGTPNYIAPEVLLRQGYSSCCDWWSVGVILYEMLVGQPPFYAKTPLETQQKVVNWERTLKIPNGMLNPDATNIIERLCCGNENRLGKNGAEEIKHHPFFAPIEFEGLRKQRAPWKPEIKHPLDTSNFDPVDSDEESDDEVDKRTYEHHMVNGKYPDHAFFEFTFKRFFDDAGHPYPSIKHTKESLLSKESDKHSETNSEANSPVYV